MTSAWLTWVQLEQYSALHNIPFASKSDGFDGLDAQLEINSKAHVKHMQRLLDMAKEGTFKYAGRDSAPEQLLISGEAGIQFTSSAARGNMVKSAKFDWGMAYPAVRSRDHQDAAQFDHRRRQHLDDDCARTGHRRNTRRRRRSCNSSASRRSTRSGRRTPATCR